MATNKLFLGLFVHSKALKELEYLHDTAVCVDKEGKIVAIESDCGEDRAKKTVLPRLGWAEAEVEIVKAKEGQFFFPGFIDTHIHAPQYPNAGIFGNSTLLDWLNTYTFPLEASLSDLAKARQVYTRVIHKTLSHGTTCAAYYATIDVPATNLLADLCHARGQRALIGRVCMNEPSTSPANYRDESAAASLAATRASIAHIQHLDPTAALIRPIITPRFAPSCTFPLLQQLAHLATTLALPIQTHISENPAEIALVQQLFPPTLTGAPDTSYAAVYDAAGLLTARTVLAHAVHLTEAEAALVARRRAKVSHCPCSNTALGSGAARVRWLLDQGVTCGLGTDVSGGFSASVLVAARAAVMVSRHVVFLRREEDGRRRWGGMEREGEGEAGGQGGVVNAVAGVDAGGTGVDGGVDGDGNVGVGVDVVAAKEREKDKEKEQRENEEREKDKLSVEEGLFLATRGGAEVVGLEDRVGGFAVGMEWDAQLVGLGVVGKDGEAIGDDDGGDVDVFGWESWPDRVAKWVYTGDDRNTKMVWVKGRLVHTRK